MLLEITIDGKAKNSAHPLSIPWRSILKARVELTTQARRDGLSIQNFHLCISEGDTHDFLLRKSAPVITGEAMEFEFMPRRLRLDFDLPNSQRQDQGIVEFCFAVIRDGREYTFERHRVQFVTPFRTEIGSTDGVYVGRESTKEKLLQELRNLTEDKVVLLRGPICSGKTTLLTEIIHILQKEGVLVVKPNPNQLAENCTAFWACRRFLDQEILNQYTPSSLGVGQSEGRLREELARWRTVPSLDEYEKGEEKQSPHNLRNKLNSHKPERLILVLDEIDRLALRPGTGRENAAQVALQVAINQILRDTGRGVHGLQIPMAVVVADWCDLKDRCGQLKNQPYTTIEITSFGTDDVKKLIYLVFNNDLTKSNEIASFVTALSDGNPLIVNIVLHHLLALWLSESYQDINQLWRAVKESLQRHPNLLERAKVHLLEETRDSSTRFCRLTPDEDKLYRRIVRQPAELNLYNARERAWAKALEARGLVKVESENQAKARIPILKQLLLSMQT